MRGVFLVGALVSAVISVPCAAVAQSQSSYVFLSANSPLAPLTFQVGASQVVVALPGQNITVADSSAASGDAYAFETQAGASTVCSTTCNVAIPAAIGVLQRFVLKRQRRLLNIPEDLTPFYVLTVPAKSAQIVTTSGPTVLSVTLPEPLPQLLLKFTEQDGAPVIEVSSPLDPTKPGVIVINTGTLTFPNGLPGTAAISATMSLNGVQLQLAFQLSARTINADAVIPPGQSLPAVSLPGAAKATVSALHLIGNANAVQLLADATFSDPLFGTLTASNVLFVFDGSQAVAKTEGVTWHPSITQLTLGPLALTFTDATLSTASDGSIAISIKQPVVSSNCGRAILPDLAFANGTIIGANSVPGGDLPLGVDVPFPLGSACIRASQVTLLTPGPQLKELRFTAALAAPWLPSGASISAPHVDLTWDATNKLKLSDDIVLFYVGPPFAIGDLIVENPSARLSKSDRTFHLLGLLNGTAIDATIVKDIFRAELRNATFSVAGMSLTRANGRFTFGNTGSVELDDAHLSLSLGPKSSAPLDLAITSANALAPALAVDWSGKTWIRRKTAANVDLNGDVAVVDLPPVQFRIARYDGGAEKLRTEFAGCDQHAAALDGVTGGLVLCGELREAAASGSVKSAVANFCAHVGAIYSPGQHIEFSTIERTVGLETPASQHPKCIEGFDFENLFRARFETFVLEWGEASGTKTACGTISGLCLIADVLVTPLGGVPGLNMNLFDSALFGFQYTPQEATLSGVVTSLHEFSVPNVASYKVTSLQVIGSYKPATSETHVSLRAGDSSAMLAGPLGITVYGKGGGLEYDRDKDNHSHWKTRFPGIQIPRTLYTALASLLTNAGSYSVLTKGIKFHFWPFGGR